jgi:dsRNA-specific ribonuclease
MEDTDTSTAGELQLSSTTAQSDSQLESTLPPSTSSPVKREHEDDDEATEDLPNKRQKTLNGSISNGMHDIVKSKKHGPMGQLQRALDWLESSEDFTQEVKEHAQKLRSLVVNPGETDFKGYRIEQIVAPSSEDNTASTVANVEAKEEDVANPHTNVPPPFALPNKANFTKGPVPAVEQLNKIAPPLSTFRPVPAAKNFRLTSDPAAPVNTVLPAAPQITNVALSMAPFMHTSLLPAYVAPTGTNSYEPLEFLGDAYLEVIATRLIHSRFPLHTVGQKAGLRELLVKNETLAEYSNAYGFGERVQSSHKERHGPVWTKVLGDVFEAYLACVIIQDETSDEGFLQAERWLTDLWAPKILAWRSQGDGLSDTSKMPSQPLDPKTDLNRLLTGKDAKVEYKEEKEMQLIKEGNRTVFFMGVYLTGWGFTNQHLGSGEGRSKQIASTAAAEWALRNSQDVIQTAHQRKVQFERQFKKSAGRGGGGQRGGGRGGFGGRGGGRGGFNNGGPHQQPYGGPPPPQFQAGAPLGGYPQHPPQPQHQMPPQYMPQQPPPMVYPQHQLPQQPPPGGWGPPRYG